MATLHILPSTPRHGLHVCCAISQLCHSASVVEIIYSRETRDDKKDSLGQNYNLLLRGTFVLLWLGMSLRAPFWKD